MSGSVLILSLWVLLILVTLTLSMSFQSSLYAQTNRVLAQSFKARLAAQAGIEQSLVYLLNQNEGIFENQSVEEDRTFFHASFTDLNRLIPINVISLGDLENILRKIEGFDPELIAPTIRWVENHDEIEHFEELLSIEGFRPQSMEILKEHFSILTGSINLNTVSSETLHLIGMSSSTIKALNGYRARHAFEAIDEISDKNFTPAEVTEFKTLNERIPFGVFSTFFKIESRGQVIPEGTSVKISAKAYRDSLHQRTRLVSQYEE